MTRLLLDYLGRDLIVVANHVPRADTIYITFDHMRPRSFHQAVALGEGRLSALGYSQVHVFCLANNWFQTSEMEEAIAYVRGSMSGYRRSVLWGSSMGGFAALQFAHKIEPDAVLASSPQVSINPEKVPWDDRYRSEAAAISAFIYDDVVNVPLPAKTYLAYDPGLRLDRLNVREIQKAHPRAKALVMPFSGHVPMVFMVGQAVITMALRGLAEGSVDEVGFSLARRAGRRSYEKYMEALSAYCEKRRERTSLDRH